MAAAHADYTFRHDHLLGIEGLHPLDIAHILDLADTYAEATRAGSREQYLVGRGLRSGGSTVRTPPVEIIEE